MAASALQHSSGTEAGPGEFRVESAGPGDLHAIAALAARALEPVWSEASFRAELSQPGCRAVVAVRPEAADATVAVRREAAGTAWPRDLGGYALGSLAADEAELRSIAVDPALRRRGVGRLLFGELCARFVRDGARRCVLEVRESNVTARAFYAELGLEPVGRRPHYYPGGEDALLYGANL